MSRFSLVKRTFRLHLYLTVTFESLELEQSYLHHLKSLMCGINASRGQRHGCMFIIKMALLLHKVGLVKAEVPTTYCDPTYLIDYAATKL